MISYLNKYLLDILLNLPHPTRYWIAFSGGVDSICLLHAINMIRERLPAPINAVHLNHGLQMDSNYWVIHCQNICSELAIECTTLNLNVQLIPGQSLEATARTARLDAYQKVMQDNDMMLTAQHQNDQAETYMLQLLRGSGLPGLASMPKFITFANGYLVRPLLDISRQQLIDYAQYHKLTWIEDPSNADTKFERNYLRHKIFPELKHHWPGYATTITRSAAHCAEALNLLNELLQPQVQAARGSIPGTLSKAALLNLTPELCRGILRYWIQARGYKLPNTCQLHRIQNEILTAAADRNPIVTWTGAEVRRYRDDIFIMSPLPPLPTINILWESINEICVLPNNLGQLQLVTATNTLGIDINLFHNSKVEIRFGVPSERCRLPNTIHHCKIKHLYQKYAIPDWIRPYIPMIYINDTLITIAGICQCIPLIENGVKITWEVKNLPIINKSE